MHPYPLQLSSSIRPLLIAALASLALACGRDPYVLVHGAFMGAWGWDDTAQALKDQGAQVRVVELPAHGQDQTAVSGATLDAYVDAVGAAVDAAGGKVTLVGHSMAGMVISQYAERNPTKVSRLVYLAAYLPKNDQSLTDLAYTDSGSHLGPALEINGQAGTGHLPSAQLQDIFCADCTSAQVTTIQAKYRDEPLAPMGTKVQLTEAAFGKVPKFYVFTTQDNAVSYGLQQSMTAGVTLAGSATLESSHSPFLSKNADLVKALQGF